MLTEKEKNTVQTVEKSTQPSEEEAPTAPALKLPSKAELFKNPMKFIGMAVETYQQMDARMTNVENAIMTIAKHIDESDKKLAPLVDLAEKVKQARTAQPQNTSQPTGIPSSGGNEGLIQLLMQMAPALLGGGGGQSERMTKLSEDLMQASIDRLKSDVSFAKAFQDAVIGKIASKTASEIVE